MKKIASTILIICFFSVSVFAAECVLKMTQPGVGGNNSGQTVCVIVCGDGTAYISVCDSDLFANGEGPGVIHIQ
jgi:hypothetical protein